MPGRGPLIHEGHKGSLPEISMDSGVRKGSREGRQSLGPDAPSEGGSPDCQPHQTHRPHQEERAIGESSHKALPSSLSPAWPEPPVLPSIRPAHEGNEAPSCPGPWSWARPPTLQDRWPRLLFLELS